MSKPTTWKKYMKAGVEAHQRGQYAKAEKQLLVALKEAEKFGEQDARLAMSLNNLAELYRTQGKYAAAESLCRRALAIREKALGPEHPDVATVLNNLAVLYKVQEKYTAAEPLYRRALAILGKTLGPEHPNVAKTLENYAQLLWKTNKEAEAAILEFPRPGHPRPARCVATAEVTRRLVTTNDLRPIDSQALLGSLTLRLRLALQQPRLLYSYHLG